MPDCKICNRHKADSHELTAHMRMAHGIEDMDKVVNGIEKALDKVMASPTPKIGQGVTMGKETPKATPKAPKTMMVEVKDSQGAIVGTLLATERTFATGSRGFGAYGKIGVKGSSQGYYQVGVNIVLVGSKPTK